ncbi:MAG: ribonuclease J [Hyphomicrobiales bacterium]
MSEKQTSAKPSELVYLPLGGAGEIGMNLYLYGYGPVHQRRWLIVDMGVKFGDERDPGIDIVLPDIQFIESERAGLEAIVLTHCHEDHFGAVAWLWDRLRCPVYASPFAAEMLRRRLLEFGLDDDFPLNIIKPGDQITLGPFGVEFIAMAHSIPEPMALAIRTDAGAVVHSGDWKIDHHDVADGAIDDNRLREIGAEGVRALICDSTNATREGSSISEADVAENLSQIIAKAEGRVLVTSFASNVARLEAVAKAAYAAGRHFVVAGRSMFRVISAARAAGYLKDVHEVLEEEDMGFLPPDKVVCLCTGSQGEDRAALARIAANAHRHITLEPGDMVIFSSKTIPGNEKSVGFLLNSLAEQGVEIITSDDALVHTSGHPRQEELRQMYDWLKPELVVPMHGEMLHMTEHAKFAAACGVPETCVARNGDMVRLAPGPGEVIDEAPAGRIHVDGKLIVSAVEGPARQRRKLGFAGAVVVSITINRKGDLASDPKAELFGLPEEDAYGVVLEDALLDVVEDTFFNIPTPARKTEEVVAEALRRAVRRECANLWGKKPQCTVLVHRV